MTITDQEFITQIESLTLHPHYFNHRGHLRLAWLYLNQYPLAVATEKTAVGIQNYATHLGASDKFHMTLTVAAVNVVNGRILPTQSTTFDQFLEQNRDLSNDFLGLLKQHYSSECLFSRLAKEAYVEPDLRPFTEVEIVK